MKARLGDIVLIICMVLSAVAAVFGILTVGRQIEANACKSAGATREVQLAECRERAVRAQQEGKTE